MNLRSDEPALNEAAEARILILSDGKPGHLNQSIAFARLLGVSFAVRRVRFRNRLCKALSYLFDRLGIRPAGLLSIEDGLPRAPLVVSAGSETYYANRVLARMLSARSVALMWPGGYRPEFDLIVAQQHDRPPARDNLLELPVNLSAPVPQGLVEKAPHGGPSIAVIIGGPSKHFRFDPGRLEQQLQQIFRLFPGGDFMVTTSRRTPPEVEAILEQLPFRYRLLYSQRQDNPLGDFLELADYLFITEDSTSMISEAVCWGNAAVELLPLEATGAANKIRRMQETLAAQGCLHRFDGSLTEQRTKIDLRQLLHSAVPTAWLTNHPSFPPKDPCL